MTRNEILQFIFERWPRILMGGYRNNEGADSQELLKNHLNELGDSLILHLQDFGYDQALRGKLYNIAEKLNDDPMSK